MSDSKKPPDAALLKRASEAATKYKAKLNSPDAIARFAVWFLAQEKTWHPISEDPPRGAPVLIWDTTRNIVRVGWNEVDGWHFDPASKDDFRPGKWQRIHF